MIGRLVHRFEYRIGRRVASKLRQRWVIFRHPDATIRFGRRVYVGRGFSVDIPADGTLIVGDDCEFRRNCRVEIVGDGRVTIGNGSYLTYGVILACSRSITIEDDVHVNSSSTILADVGRGAIVAAHSVVKDRVAAHTLVAGAPAEPVEYFGP